ncbi:MAG: hypothetical protein A2136_00310 [Chloroflexi bacterium RBG_16_54_11]|nr:MAG: hypothetical protein A2136_00310 [Chloroflexi bacterium RBG_16_54_11]
MKKTLLMPLLVLLLTACMPPASDAADQGLVEQAAAEATAILKQAQATALLIQAQAEATAIMAQAGAQKPTSTPHISKPVLSAGGSSTPIATATISELKIPASTTEQAQNVEVERVGFAADGGLIIIQFKAPSEVADKWWQGSVSVVDEASGVEYREIPVMPKIGPLISRPQITGQIGNVMLVNQPPGLKVGALVTVILGNYTFEHIQVQE